MSSWALRRQLLILVVPVILFIGGGYFFYSQYVYQAPTCSDRKQNGGETGVDCGGGCQLICSDESIAPVVVWTKSFQVTGTVYNTVAYIQNPNNTSRSSRAAYEFRLFDATGTVVATRQGTIDIQSGKTFAVFQGGIQINGKNVKRTEFSFTSPLVWVKDTSHEPVVTVTHTPLENASTSPRLSGRITNPNLSPIGETELVALVLDGRGNTIDVSKTVIDSLSPQASAPFVFTWLKPITVGADVCTNSSKTLVLLDRSTAQKKFSSVVQDTTDFFNAIASSSPQVGYITFASTTTVGLPGVFGTAQDASDMLLSAIAPTVATTTSGKVATTTPVFEQGNNLAGALDRANQLFSSGVSYAKTKVLVVVLGGNPNLPQDAAVGNNYPTVHAEAIAADMINKGVSIYTIGVGGAVDKDMVRLIAGSSDRAFEISDASGLASVYAKISGAMCRTSPNTIQILSRAL